MPTPAKYLDETVRNIRNKRAQEAQRQQMLKMTERNIRVNRAQKEAATRQENPGQVQQGEPVKNYSQIQDEFDEIERRLSRLIPGGRAGFDDILRDDLLERQAMLMDQVETRRFIDDTGIPEELMQATPVQQQQARPRNPRRWAHTLPDGLHYDNKGVPFRVEDGRIADLTEEEAARWAEVEAKKAEIEALKQENANRVIASKADIEKAKLEEYRQSVEYKKEQQRSLNENRKARSQPKAEPAAKKQASQTPTRGARKAKPEEEVDPRAQQMNALTKSLPSIEAIAELPVADLGAQVGNILDTLNQMVEAGNLPRAQAGSMLDELTQRVKDAGREEELNSFFEQE